MRKRTPRPELTPVSSIVPVVLAAILADYEDAA